MCDTEDAVKAERAACAQICRDMMELYRARANNPESTTTELVKNLGIKNALMDAAHAIEDRTKLLCDICLEEHDHTDMREIGRALLCMRCAEEACDDDDRRENERIYDAAGR
jgi:hypothetical protein